MAAATQGECGWLFDDAGGDFQETKTQRSNSAWPIP